MRAKKQMKSTEEISNSQDIMDSRDVIARIEYLDDERAALADRLEELQGDEVTNHVSEIAEAKAALDEWDASEEGAELKSLQSLAEKAEGCGDWQYGETLIRESYFEDYARQLAEDIGAIKGDESWPLSCIDWERAAQELRMDYSSAEFGGVTYYIRS